MKQAHGSERHSLDRTFDWPLSRTEKKDVLMRISRRDLEDQARQLQRMRVSPDCRSDISLGERSDLSSVKPSKGGKTTQDGGKTSLDGWEPNSEPSGTPRQPEPEVLCTPRRLSLESGSSDINATKSLSTTDIKQTLESLQEDMVRQQQKQFEDFQKLQQQQLQDFLARLQAKGTESTKEESNSDCESRDLNLHHSCPARALHTTPPRPALKRRSRGGSLGGSAQQVRFVEQDSASSTDEESDVKVCTTSAFERGRSRRVSRGPDGRPYSIPDHTGKSKDATSKTASGDYTKAAAGTVAGGALGLGAGMLGGAVAALPAALFTFGLSIPIGAAFGGGLGCSAGAGAGALVGYKMGTTGDDNAQTTAAEGSEESELSEASDQPGE